MVRSLMYRKWVPIFLSKCMITILKALLHNLLYTHSEGMIHTLICMKSLFNHMHIKDKHIAGLSWAGLGG